MQEEGFVNISPLLHCAVYALVYRRVVVYIGQSKTPSERIRTHIRQRKGGVKKSGLYSNRITVGFKFDEVWLRPCMLSELDNVEIAMIKKFQPKYNVKHKDVVRPEISLEQILATMPPMMFPINPPCPEPRAWRRF
jgi:hypothetical protein